MNGSPFFSATETGCQSLDFKQPIYRYNNSQYLTVLIVKKKFAIISLDFWDFTVNISIKSIVLSLKEMAFRLWKRTLEEQAVQWTWMSRYRKFPGIFRP